jgi:hypothetical protein
MMISRKQKEEETKEKRKQDPTIRILLQVICSVCAEKAQLFTTPTYIRRLRVGFGNLGLHDSILLLAPDAPIPFVDPLLLLPA